MSLKFKQILWKQLDERKFISEDTLPQILYRIDMGWDEELDEPGHCQLRFYHGFSRADYSGSCVVTKGTAEHCKEYAQRHFEQYIRDSFFEPIN